MVINLIFRYKWLIAFAVLLSVMSAFAGVGIIGLLEKEISSFSSSNEPVAHSMAWFVSAIAAVVVFGIASQYILSKLSASVIFDVRKIMVERLMGTSYEKIENIGGHRVFATLTDDVSSISRGLMLFPQFVNSFTTVLLCFAYMLYSSWQLFSVIAIMIVIIVLVAYFLLQYGVINQEKLRELDDELFSGYKALIDGGKEISVSSARKKFVHDDMLIPAFGKIQKMTVKAELVFNVLSNWTTSLILSVMGVIVFGSQHILTGVPADVVVAFMLIVLYLIDPLETLVDMLDEFGEAIVAHKKIKKLQLADVNEYIDLNSSTSDSFKLWSSIYLKNITYSYPSIDNAEYQFSVGPINLKINRGETIFFVGGNGSGKSTVAKLICGLYSNYKGGIYMDDCLVDMSISGTSYRDQFSTIFSDFYLFEQALDSSGQKADDTVVERYLNKMMLTEKVSVKGGVLSSIKMSQGQKKRLALVLSYLEDSPVCIYDEWAADQDPQFREMFYTSILPELKAQGKTLIVITHDDRYFHLCDKLIKFDSGVIVDSTNTATG